MKQFLILAETGNTGYFVEIVTNLETALSREKLFFELAFNPPTDHVIMREEFKPLGTFKINVEATFFIDYIAGSFNGCSATYIIEIEEDFNFEHFASLRNSSKKSLSKIAASNCMILKGNMEMAC